MMHTKGDQVKISVPGGPFTGLTGTVVSVISTPAGPKFHVDWGDKDFGLHLLGDLAPAGSPAMSSVLVEARSAAGVYILDSGSIAFRDVMKTVKSYMLIPGVTHIIMFKDGEQFKAWWRTMSGVWIHAGRIPKRTQILKGDVVTLSKEGKSFHKDSGDNPHFLTGYVVATFMDKRWLAPIQVRWMNGFSNFYDPKYLTIVK